MIVTEDMCRVFSQNKKYTRLQRDTYSDDQKTLE